MVESTEQKKKGTIDLSEMSQAELINLVESQRESLAEYEETTASLREQMDTLVDELRGKSSNSETSPTRDGGAEQSPVVEERTPANTGETPDSPDVPDNVEPFLREAEDTLNQADMSADLERDVLARLDELNGRTVSDEMREQIDNLRQRYEEALENTERGIPNAVADPPELGDITERGRRRAEEGHTTTMEERDEAEERAERADQRRAETESMSDAEVSQTISSLIDEDNADTDRNTPEAEARRNRILELMDLQGRREQGEATVQAQEAPAAATEGTAVQEGAGQENPEAPQLIDRQELLDVSGYRDLEAARTDYLERLAKRRRFARRGSDEERVLAREEYKKALVEWEGNMIRTLQERGYTSEQIAQMVAGYHVQETLTRTREEVDIAENGRFNKAKNWLKRHRLLRFSIGAGLMAGSIAAGAVGIWPLSAGLFGAGRAFRVATGTVAAEAIIDSAGDKYGQKWGSRKDMSAEQLDQMKEDALNSHRVTDYIGSPEGVERSAEDDIMAQINRKLSDRIAHSIRRGETFDESDETVQRILLEKRRQVAGRINAGLSSGGTPESVRASVLAEAVRVDVHANEDAQARARKRSIGRWSAAGILGLVVGGGAGGAIISHFTDQGGEAVATTPIPRAGGIRGLGAAANEVAQEHAAQLSPAQIHDNLVNGFQENLVAVDGAGEWHLASTAVDDYVGYMSRFENISLNPTQHIIAVDRLKDLAVAELGHPQVGVENGLPSGFERLFTGPRVQEAINYALTNPNG